MERYIDLSHAEEKHGGHLQISFEYTALDGATVRGEKCCDCGLSEALELFACLSIDSLPIADLSKPYKLTVLSPA